MPAKLKQTYGVQLTVKRVSGGGTLPRGQEQTAFYICSDGTLTAKVESVTKMRFFNVLFISLFLEADTPVSSISR
jgi:hypothetical protein